MATEKEIIQAISEIDNVETLRDIFAAIAAALRAKGIDQNPIYPEQFASLIGMIETGIDTDDADAQATDIAKNKTAYVGGKKITGSVTDVKAGSTTQNGNFSLTGFDATAVHTIRIINTFANNILFREGGRLQLSMDSSEFGTATTADVLSGKTFTGASGLKKTGTLVPQTGTNTSDATATASDIASGKIAYGASGKIVGNVSETPSGNGVYLEGDVYVYTVDTTVPGTILNIRTTINKTHLIRSGANVFVEASLSTFGDATPADVAAGKTFTSSYGYKQTGTARLS